MYYQNPAIQNEIRRRAKEGLVIFTLHGDEQAGERDIDDEEILKCLKSGTLESEDWNPEYQDKTYCMSKNHCLNSKLIVVVALSDTHDIVVTTFRKKTK